VQDPVPGARDQAGVAEFFEVLVDEKFNDRAGRDDRGRQRVGDVWERDDDAVAVWKAEVWPDIKGWPMTWAPTSASRTRQARG
jgi:hypothetical protein